jgi:hypothetical protein
VERLVRDCRSHSITLPAQIHGDKAMVSVRQLERLGWSVRWDPDKNCLECLTPESLPTHPG